MNYWLMKSEPDVFGIDDLIQCPDQTEPWNGIRNYQARNFLRDEVKRGDLVFFYHSSTKIPGVAGIMEVVSSAYPDALAFDPNSPYFDPKSTPDNPRWYCVDVKFVEKFHHVIPLTSLKARTELQNFALVKKGSRLSVMPVSAQEWQFILNLKS